MKTKILSLLFALIASVGTMSAANYSGSCGTDLIWTLNTNDSVLNIYGSGAMDDYSSSSSAPWYSYRSKIKGVNLPNELTSIGNYAFNDCSNLASITFNENLESIGSYSFYKCKALKSIYLPNSITSIGDKAFASSLATTITIEKNTPPSIGKNVFPSGTMIDNSSGLPEIVEIRTTIYVPCELVQIYQTQWKDYSSQITSIPFPYTIGILMKSQGKLVDTKNNVSVVCNEGFKLSAPTYYGYHFVRWDDGDTDNPRSVDNVTTNKIFTAEYDINYYSLSVTCDSEKGSVNPTFGEYAHASEVSISASPNQGYIFKRWSDANTDNPRTITITNNTEISAIFVEENPLKSISVNGEPIAIADSMIFYDVHDDSYIPQIEVTASSITATATVAQLDKADYGWYAIIRVAESNNSIKEYKLFIINNIIKHTARITLTGEDRTSFFISTDNDAFGSVVGSTLHQYGDERQSSFLNQTGYKLGNRPSHIGMLFTSNALQEGDIVSVLMTKESNIGEDELFFYSDEGNTPLCTIKGVYSPGLYSFELGSNAPQLRAIYLYRKDMEMNPHVAYLEVTRISSVYNYSISCDESKGSVSMTNKGNIVIAHAIPNAGYSFSQWNDGNTDNPRTITLTQDTLLVAEFTQNAISRYQVQFVDWDGTILHTDSVDYGASATAPANPTREGYMFTGWDKAFDNVTEDMVVTALYENNICIIASGSCGDNLTWEISCDSVLTISGTGPMTDWNGNNSTSVNPTQDVPWYNFHRNIREIIVEDGVTSIGERAFMSCWKLIKCSIGNSVTSIGVLAFYGCYNMPSVTIPNNVSTIGARAFESCYKLESVTIPQNVTSLGETAFGNCDSLTTIIWNAVNCTIQGSNHSPFYNIQEKGNNKITSFIVGDSVEHLPAHLCYNMSKLNSINIPSSIKSIKPEAFYGTKLLAVHISDIAAWCRINFMSSKTANPLYYAHHLYLNGEEITNLVIPDGVTEISNRAFVGYSTMESISIPNTVVRIGHTAFDSCTGLTSIVIPDGVTEIGNQAFMRCSNLQHVSIGDNVISIGNEVFKGCTSLITPIYNSHTFFVMPTSYSGAYIIPDGIENVIGSAFYQCNGLTSLNIPNSVKLIGEGAFIECSNLAEITIGTGVSKLGKNVFNKCANIKKVQWNAINYRQTKPNNDSNCFPFYASRDSITSFAFGEEVEYIPEYLLKDFSAIHSLIIPASVTNIAQYAFANDSLTELTCLAEIPPTIDSTAIAGMNTSTCVLYVPYSSVNTYRNAKVWKEFVNIRAIGADEVEEPEDDIVVTPSNTTASITWALISNAVSYELVIRDMNGTVICTLTFNAYGQLTGIAFAPNRNRHAQQTQVAGFQFTVSGLENGTTYEYEFNAKDETDNIIETFTGTFTTTNDTPTSVENTPENMLNVPKKVMYNYQIYIIRGEKTYTMQGQEVK